ncbi:MAG: hypothetical protein M1833_000431 [Piccolia ochrophora]|nr:MAG: hypothetical protein M1833_000431 [Piccolia ochrophora]
MPVSLALAAPATAASLAYLYARTSLGYDLLLFSSMLRAFTEQYKRVYWDRINLYYQLEAYALSKRFANRPLLWYDGQQWSYKQTYDMVLKYGAWLKATHDVKPGEIVAMDFMNSSTFIFVWLAIWSLGAMPAFINYNLVGKPLMHCVRSSTARLLLVEEEVQRSFSPHVLEAFSSSTFRDDGQGPVQLAVVTHDTESRLISMEPVRQPDFLRSGALRTGMAILIFTSGTTGLPKAAIVSWSKVNFASLLWYHWLGWKDNDRVYTCMPLYHSSAAVLAFCGALNGGSSIAIGRSFSTKTFWSEVRDSHATIIQYVGETCRYLLAAPPQIDPATGSNLDSEHSVRMAFGNGLRPDVWNPFKDRFGIETIAEFYAATEGSFACWNKSRNDFAQGAIGRSGSLASALLNGRIAVVQVDWKEERPHRDAKTGLCTKVKPGDPGELLFVLDPNDVGTNFQGYFRNAKATESKVLRDALKKGDAWFRTGDVVRLDREGRWYFHDRIGDTFRWKGENVSTTEVSESMSQHCALSETNVYGVPIPHHDGSAGMAAVQLARGQEATPTLMASLAEHALQHLPRYAVPVFLRVTSNMQRTGTNKQQKHLLRDEGVNLDRIRHDRLFWLKDGTYSSFDDEDWTALRNGRVKL